MNTARKHFWIEYPTGFFKVASWVLPSGFRKEYAEEMRLVFRDCCIEAYRSKGWIGALSETAKGMFDLVISAIKETSDRFFDDTARQYEFLVVSFLAICAGIFIASSVGVGETPNPIFLAYMFGFTLGCSRPRGFWLIGLIIGSLIPFIDLGMLASVAGSTSGALFRQGLNYGTKRFA